MVCLKESPLRIERVCFTDNDRMRHLYRLRLKVYGEQCGFFNIDEYPEGEERDKYDAQSAHFLIRDGLSRKILIAARLILPGAHRLPVFDHVPELYRQYASCTKACAEISRFVLNKSAYFDYQKRRAAALGGVPTLAVYREMFSILYAQLYQRAVESGIQHGFALMEKGLYRLAKLQGFSFAPVGETIDVYGPVKPYYLEVASLGYLQQYAAAQNN
ncbi:MAG: GNAT family N-acyltransferase [Candidatus Omnitrophota bacterium]